MLTVLMVVRNGFPYVKEAVDSILNQSFGRFYFIIINNASEDGTTDYLRRIKDYRVLIYCYNKIGFTEAINFGLTKVNTKFVTTMDADDIAERTKLEKQINFLENNPDIGLVGTNINFFVNDKNRNWQINFRTGHNEIVEGLLAKKYVLCHPTTMIRTTLIKKIGGLRNDFYFAPDLDMFLRLSKITKLANLPEHLFFYRISNHSITSQNLRDVVKHQRRAIEAFKNQTKKNQFLNNFVDRLNYFSLFFYKKGLYYYLDGSKIVWLFLMLLAGIMNPVRGYYHMVKKLTK